MSLLVGFWFVLLHGQYEVWPMMMMMLLLVFCCCCRSYCLKYCWSSHFVLFFVVVLLFNGVVRCFVVVADFVLVDGFRGGSNRWFLHFMPGVHEEQCLPALRHAQFLAFVPQVANLVQSQHHVPVPTFCRLLGGLAVMDGSSSPFSEDVVKLGNLFLFFQIDDLIFCFILIPM